MAPPHTANSPQKEGRIDLAVNALQKHQFKSERQAARVYKVPRTTLHRRQNGILPKQGSKAPNRLLLDCEEEQLIQWIQSLERRGFPPAIIDVKRMAQTLLARRGSTSKTISKN
jgi:hypothetical protein